MRKSFMTFQNRAAFRSSLRLGAAILLVLPALAAAQSDEPAPGTTATSADEGRIVVTGSRISRPDYTATSPIVTIDQALIEETSQINLEANLNKLPQFTPALTQFATENFQANANTTIGVSTVSLRQLGSNRNLVLLDGRRATPVNGQGVVDINSIPSAAVQRVEVISGGASSTYGADAVGGVVNFILKRDFTGLAVDAQYGLSERGDGDEYRISTLVGANIDGGRGNVMLGLEHYKREQVLRLDRPWFQDLARDPQVAGTEFFLTENNITFPTLPGGSPATNYQPSQAALNTLFRSLGAPNTVDIPRSSTVYLNADGSSFINTSTRLPVPPGQTGAYVPLFYGYQGPIDGLSHKILANGQLAKNNEEALLSTPQTRYSFFARGDYEVVDDVRFITQANFSRTQTRTLSLNTVATGSFGQLIPYDNNTYTGNPTLGIASSLLANGSTNADYRPGGRYGLNCSPVGGCTNKQVFPVTPEIAALLDSRPNPTAPWQSNIIPSSIARRYTDNYVTTYQMLAGFEGDIEGVDWSWDVTGSYGETIAKTDTFGFFSGEAFRAIVQSPNYGRNFRTQGNNVFPGANRNGATASCTSGISPFNTSQVYSEDCGIATRIDAQVENRLKQQLVEANLQGGLFNLPAGELRFAVGGGIRTNSLAFHADSSSVEGATFIETVNGIFPQASTAGSITVREAYGELLIPVLADLPFIEQLNLEVGYRLSDYSTTGSNGTYKINGEWEVADFLRFRGGYQRAVRAPNLGEVFTARTQTLVNGADGDPCSRSITVAPFGYGNYSANTAANPDGAKVEALCRQLMGAGGAAQFYRDGRTYPTNGVTAFVTSISAGSGELKPETATTYTIGGVLSSPIASPWLSRLRISADYYNIKLVDGISLQGVDSVYRQCFSKLLNPSYQINDACNRIARDQLSGETQQIGVAFSNLGRVETSGFDIQMDWGLRFEDAGLGLPGMISVNSNFTYLLKFATTADQAVVPLTDFAGTSGGGEVGTNAGSYRWKLFSRLSYDVGDFGIGVQWRHLPELAHLTTVTTSNSTIAATKAYDLFNLSGNYAVNDMIQMRFGVDNLFDRAPPISSVDNSVVAGDGRLAGGSIDSGNYDVLGRRFFVGVSLNF
jgi:iron complex outermembrane receptor protein